MNYKQKIYKERSKRRRAWWRHFLHTLPDKVTNFLAGMIALFLLGMTALLFYVAMVVMFL